MINMKTDNKIITQGKPIVVGGTGPGGGSDE